MGVQNRREIAKGKRAMIGGVSKDVKEKVDPRVALLSRPTEQARELREVELTYEDVCLVGLNNTVGALS